MLDITSDALAAIKAMTGPDEGGLRITAASPSMNGHGPGFTLEAAPAPDPDDAVVEAEGAEVYLDAAAARILEGKVLDAEVEAEGVRFSIIEPE